MPVNFVRRYASLLAADLFDSQLGPNWIHNFGLRLEFDATRARVQTFDGRTVAFERNAGGWTLTSIEKLPDQLIDTPQGGFRFLNMAAGRIYEFNSQGQLPVVEDRKGNRHDIIQGSNGPAGVFDGLGRSLSFTYTGGRLNLVQDQTGRGVEFEYSGGLLTTVTDTRRETTFYMYDPGEIPALLSGTILPDGSRPVSHAFDSLGRVTAQTDGEGATSEFLYQASSATRTDPLGFATTYSFDPSGNVLSIADPLDNVETFAYDANNRPAIRSSPLGLVTSHTYDPASGLLTSLTKPGGQTTLLSYEKQSQGGFDFFVLARTSYSDGVVTEATYDGNGNATQIVDSAGQEWNFSYNNQGQLSTATSPSGSLTELSYNDDGTLAQVTDPDGITKNLLYDELGRFAGQRYADGTEQTIERNLNDDITVLRDPLAQAVRFTYDGLGQITSVIDPLRRATRITYDDNSQITRITNRLGQPDSAEYDDAGRLIRLRNTVADERRFTRDAHGLVTAVISRGTDVLQAFDSDGRLTETRNALNRRVQLAHDENGNVIQVTGPSRQRSVFAYDSRDRLVSSADPNGRGRSFAYDALGRLSSSSIGQANVEFQRNSFGQPEAVTDPNGQVWHREYTPGGRLAATIDPLGNRVEYTYDTRGRVAQIDAPTGSSMLRYDGASQVVRRTAPNGTIHEPVYDANGRLTSTTGVNLEYDAEGRITNSNGIINEYDRAGRLRRVTYEEGKSVQYSYDTRGRLMELRDWIGGEAFFDRNGADELRIIKRPNGVRTRLDYDSNSRLVRVLHDSEDISVSITLERDESGLVTTETRDFPLLPTLARGALRQVFDSASQINGATYDGLGRLISDAIREYTWGEGSQLIAYEGQDGSAGFRYDGLGHRTAEGTNLHLINYATKVPTAAVERRGGVRPRYYVYLPDGTPFSFIEADGSRRFYHFDHTGSTFLLTNDKGEITDSYAYGPFGEGSQHEGSADQPYTYHGAKAAMRSDDTSLYLISGRYYDPDWGRFLSRAEMTSTDPLQINPYQFSSNNPLLTESAGPQIPVARPEPALGGPLSATCPNRKVGAPSLYPTVPALDPALTLESVASSATCVEIRVPAVLLPQAPTQARR